jgi:hypothetical protein
MSDWLITILIHVVTVIYASISIGALLVGKYPLAMAYGGYAFANIGLSLLAK